MVFTIAAGLGLAVTKVKYGLEIIPLKTEIDCYLQAIRQIACQLRPAHVRE